MKNVVEASSIKMLKAIANPKRLEIVSLLLEAELKVGDLEEKLDLSQSALSQHLAVLRRANVVKTRRSSQIIFYSLKDERVAKILKIL